jgi:hypothetical protein
MPSRLKLNETLLSFSHQAIYQYMYKQFGVNDAVF